MKAETWVMVSIGAFFAIVSPVYWIMSGDPTGTSALVMSTLLCLLVGFYLGVVAKQIPARLEDLNDGEVADGAGEYGFFPPYSWWPLFAAAAMAVVVVGIAIGWWLAIIGVGLLGLGVTGWVFEYYRGVHAH